MIPDPPLWLAAEWTENCLKRESRKEKVKVSVGFKKGAVSEIPESLISHL
jgi:hypothetical protein